MNLAGELIERALRVRGAQADDAVVNRTAGTEAFRARGGRALVRRLRHLRERDRTAGDVEEHVIGVVSQRQIEERRIVGERVVRAGAPARGGEDRVAVADGVKAGCRKHIHRRAALDRGRAGDVQEVGGRRVVDLDT